MKRKIFRSLIFAIILVIVYYAFQMLMGVYLTWKYVPDILDSYSAIDTFGSHQVAFGVKAAPVEVVAEVIIIMVIGVVTYFSGSYVTKKIRNP
ncbi:hypothetical protein HZF08_17410 [Paenibacillus sp. CGMCC 1.16610]|uniref:Uncharacterized protein n=1 Tax=Paenibacillus anseongense TaxID=2682845 RepID=A0ABW9UFW5_9BACL|nr:MULTISPECIES: hypothetical protein [Paenibacillus]MBA2940094.1 hypothetical protein [Paenibacillus sp. CGMCC 1.16610]MVQ39049.1 hypothetical protein [Paenibacillus anseongense]